MVALIISRKIHYFLDALANIFFQKKTMINMNEFFHKNKIYEISNLPPYFGEVFEIVCLSCQKYLKQKNGFLMEYIE